MREEVILKTAAELFDEICNQTKPAGEIINLFTRSHKSFGSKDRKLLTDTIWQLIRHKSRLEYLYPNKSSLEKIYILQQKNLVLDENTPFHIRMEIPEWLTNKINAPENELPALLETPPIILRATKERTVVQQKLKEEGIETEPTLLSPYGLILKKRINLSALTAYKNGLIEIQDEASQLVALETQIAPNDTVLDYCAGAGGKSLIFAQMMAHKGKIVAHDISQRSLDELQKRANRAHINIIETTTNIPAYLKANPNVQFSHVVVDAPCSGTGTWRRCPDARWKLTPEQFSSLLKKQASILKKASAFVSNGGFLVYMTCSLTNDENILQVRKFLRSNSCFKLKTHRQFSPFKTKTDGLFVAILQKEKQKH